MSKSKGIAYWSFVSLVILTSILTSTSASSRRLTGLDLVVVEILLVHKIGEGIEINLLGQVLVVKQLHDGLLSCFTHLVEAVGVAGVVSLVGFSLLLLLTLLQRLLGF